MSPAPRPFHVAAPGDGRTPRISKGTTGKAGSNRISARGDVAAATSPIGVEEFAARLIHALVSVGAKEIALGLQQVGREALAAIRIEKGPGGCPSRHADSRLLPHSASHRPTQRH